MSRYQIDPYKFSEIQHFLKVAGWHISCVYDFLFC
jgi:hypothetical protein